MHVPQELLIKNGAPKFYCMRYPCKVFIFSIGVCISCTSWKVSEYGVVLEPYFALFGLNTEIYGVNLRIHSECRKIRTRNNYVLFSQCLHFLPIFLKSNVFWIKCHRYGCYFLYKYSATLFSLYKNHLWKHKTIIIKIRLLLLCFQ